MEWSSHITPCTTHLTPHYTHHHTSHRSPHTAHHPPQTSLLTRCHFKPIASDLRPQTSHLRPRTSDLRPQNSEPHTSHLTTPTSHLRPHSSHLTRCIARSSLCEMTHTSHLTPHISPLTPQTWPSHLAPPAEKCCCHCFCSAAVLFFKLLYLAHGSTPETSMQYQNLHRSNHNDTSQYIS